MRLTKKEQDAIKTNFKKKGGDIDLYISTNNKNNLVENKINFLGALQREIGEQKIDIVLDYGEARLIDRKVKKEGIKLCEMN